jgi:hypothetical protein
MTISTMRPEPAAPLQLAFITGQSDPQRCELSPAQRAFGEALLAPGRWLYPQNFPYGLRASAHRQVPLWLASWHNASQYLLSRREAFAHRHRHAVQAVLARAPHTVLLAGSCGLELLANLQLPPDTLQRVSVFAYGPVARQTPAVARLQAVRGQSDWIARLGWRGAAVGVPGGHLDYLQHTDVLAMARAFVHHVHAELP